MTEQLNALWSRRVTFTVRDGVLLIATFVAYGALLFGTSEVVSEPAYVRAEWHADAAPELLTQTTQAAWDNWTASPGPAR